MTLVMPTESITAICDACGKLGKSKPAKSGEPKLPRNWRRFSEKLWCDKCWKANFRIVALTLPISRVMDGEWKELWTALRPQWRDCGKAMTWATMRLYAADTELQNPKDQKIGPFTAPYLYPEMGASWPELPSGTRSDLCDRARKLYQKRRLDMFLGRASLPTFHESPLPLRAQDYTLSRNDDGLILMSFRAGGRRWSVSMGNRRRFGRQLAAIEKVIAGDGIQVQAMILEKGAGRHEASMRESGGGQKRKKEIAVKVVCWLPKMSAKDATGELPVKTGGGVLLKALDTEGERIWTLNADQVQRIEGHAARIRRMGEDRKAELRQPRRRSRMHRDRLASWSDKQRRVMDTLLHQASAWLVNFAIRRKYVAVRYDDSDHSGLPSFPWARLKTMIRQKCEANGILFFGKDDVESDTSDESKGSPDA